MNTLKQLFDTIQEHHDNFTQAFNTVEISLTNKYWGDETDASAHVNQFKDPDSSSCKLAPTEPVETIAFVDDVVICSCTVTRSSLSGPRQVNGFIVLTPYYWTEYGGTCVDWTAHSVHMHVEDACHEAINVAVNERIRS